MLFNKRSELSSILKNLKMNFVHIESLMRIIYTIIFNKIKEGEYCIKNNKFTKIHKLINSLNIKLKKKIKIEYLPSKIFYNTSNKLKKFPYWDDKKNLKNFLLEKLRKSHYHAYITFLVPVIVSYGKPPLKLRTLHVLELKLLLDMEQIIVPEIYIQ